MNTIRRIYNPTNPAVEAALLQCKNILLSQFPFLTDSEAEALIFPSGDEVQGHHKKIILVAEGRNKQVLGVAFATHFHDENFIFLDYIASKKNALTGGIGGALYERLREEAASHAVTGIFFDCIPDIDLWYTEEEKKQNRARLKFYETYGARPLENINYEMTRQDRSVFHLIFDGLGIRDRIKAKECKKIVEAVLRNKASKKCSEEYIQTVLASIKKEVSLRAYQYMGKVATPIPVNQSIPTDKKIPLIINEGHLIHHVKERGYLESPIRVNSILKELRKTEIFYDVKVKAYPDKHLAPVHDPDYLSFLKKICTLIGHTTTRYGDVFPIRNQARIPKDIELQIGYYCIDTSTPLNANAYIAARDAVDCALTASDLVLNGKQMAYALVRPPGHHAERKYFGGFCYLNSNAVAAHYLSQFGKVAILDIDYHHGNGQQDIFYDRSDIYTISIHGDPEYAYPNFTGFTDELGEGAGLGFNTNITQPKSTTGPMYVKALKKALGLIEAYKPDYLVLALGLDVAKGDPSGTWLLSPDDFTINGKLIAELEIPTVIIQEGGYQNRVLGKNARHFFQGLWDGFYKR